MRGIATNLCHRTVQSLSGATRSLHTTAISYINPQWREERRLPARPNQYGPLTNRADYTFMDGRPTPLGVRARTRLDKQQEWATKIVNSCNELKFAKERHQRQLQQKESEKERVISEKPKPKGTLLLNKTK